MGKAAPHTCKEFLYVQGSTCETGLLTRTRIPHTHKTRPWTHRNRPNAYKDRYAYCTYKDRYACKDPYTCKEWRTPYKE